MLLRPFRSTAPHPFISVEKEDEDLRRFSKNQVNFKAPH
jgi:hypothetical protein